MAVTLPFHQHHIASFARFIEKPETIRTGLVAATPPELLCALHGDTKAYRGLLTFPVRIGDADGGLGQVGHVPQPHASQEVLRQLLLFGVFCERAAVLRVYITLCTPVLRINMRV